MLSSRRVQQSHVSHLESVRESGLKSERDGTMSPIKRNLLMFTLSAALAGCATWPSAPTAGAGTQAPPRDLRVSRVLADEGLRKLRQNQYEDASRIFNAGLKFAPDNAQMHFLNGLTYHLLYQRGDDAARDLAATGYEMALSIEPAHYPAALQLGRLEYEAKRYGKSAEAFRHATDIEPNSGEAYLGLAMAAYHARDLATARRAIERSTALLKDSAAAVRAEAMVYAGLGEQAVAKQAASRYAQLETDADARSQLDRRVDQWRAWHASLPSMRTGDAAPPVRELPLLAQAVPPTPPNPYPYPPGSSPPGLSPQPASSRDPAMPRWFDCDSATASATAPTGTSGTAYSGGTSSADETAPLPALPVPCKGAGNPRMAILDVAIVRTEETSSSSHGVNLLSGLNYVFSRSRQLSDILTSVSGAPDSRTVTITRQRNDSLTNPTNPGGIAYSLNIANATDARSEVLAQPSLVALDRQPSTFFSGRNITLGIAGQAGGSSTFTDKPVGVSLSVTPTFVDEETMLVSARAARSFVEQVDSNVSFGQTMQTTRNSVSANVVLKFGQTLILSGLAEQEVQRASDGVPVLQDIPLLQYLFGTKTTQNFTRSVLVLITPRKPVTEREQLASELAARTPREDGNREALMRKLESQARQSQGLAPSLDLAYRHALESKLFLQFRAGDMKADDWTTPSRLDNLLHQLGTMIYF